MNTKEKELLLQLLVEKYSKMESKLEVPAPAFKETKKYTKQKKHTRKNKDRIKWTPEMKALLLDWNNKGYSIEAFAESNNMRKPQATSMLYDLLNRQGK